jgi:hypothetical protein
LASVWSSSSAAAEQESSPESGPAHLGHHAMPEVFDVQLPERTTRTVAAAVNATYGYIEGVGDVAETQRFGGQLALSYGFIPTLRAGLSFRGHLDAFPGSDEGLNGVGEPRLRVQWQTLETDRFKLGFSAGLRLLGAGAPSISWEATSPSLRALFAVRLGMTTELALNAGFELDRSVESVRNFDDLSDADRVTLGISRGPTLPIGLGLRTFLGKEMHEGLLEVYGRPMLGDGAAAISDSPWAARLGFRPALSDSFRANLGLEVGLSARTGDTRATWSAPIEPRFGILVGLVWSPARKQEPKPKPPVPVAPRVAPPPPPQEVATLDLRGRVVTEAGFGVENAEVRISAEGKWLATVNTDAQGQFVATKLQVSSSYSLTVEAPDFDVATLSVEGDQVSEVVLYKALPRGAIEGRITDYRGAPLVATIRVTPGDYQVTSSEDGSFQVELAPGRYTLTFEAVGFRTETRVVQVEDKGVFIQNLALGN